MIYLYLFGTCFHFIYVFMIIKNILRYVMGKCRDVHVLNNLQCETHRWCMERILRIKNNI